VWAVEVWVRRRECGQRAVKESMGGGGQTKCKLELYLSAGHELETHSSKYPTRIQTHEINYI
jgi:hypothetical protein